MQPERKISAELFPMMSKARVDFMHAVQAAIDACSKKCFPYDVFMHMLAVNLHNARFKYVLDLAYLTLLHSKLDKGVKDSVGDAAVVTASIKRDKNLAEFINRLNVARQNVWQEQRCRVDDARYGTSKKGDVTVPVSCSEPCARLVLADSVRHIAHLH